MSKKSDFFGQTTIKKCGTTIEEDYEFGKKNEIIIFPKLQKKFKNLEKHKELFHRFDFESPKVLVEVKSRRNTKDKWPTTLINKSKVDYYFSENLDKKLYFVVMFTDCHTYIRYKKDKFDNYQIKFIERSSPGQEKGFYYLVDIEDLTEF